MKSLIKNLLILAIITAAVGCSHHSIGRQSTEMNKIHLGMTKSEVINSLGEPTRTSANNDNEFLIYRLVNNVNYDRTVASLGLFAPEKSKSDYFVKIINNKVSSYGLIGDFGTRLPVESTINIKSSK